MNKKKVTFHNVFYIFLFGCLIGWIVEVLWSFYRKKIFINHSALVIGPFNLVYGIGAVVLSLVLYKLKDKNIFLIFISSFVAGSVLEYVISFLMEMMFGFTAWTYYHKPFNINGRICLSYSIFWGLLGLWWIKMVYPWLEKKINSFNKKISMKVMVILIILLVFDGMLTIGAINRGKDFANNIPPQRMMDNIYDKYFGVEYLNNMFNNRWKWK